MCQPASTKSLLAFLAVMIASCALPVRAQQSPATATLKSLSAAERSEAKEARDRADLMRAELEKRLPRPTVPSNGDGRKSLDLAEVDAEAADVIRAYKEVIERYPHTEISAYCATRLAGFYVRLGRVDDAEKVVEEVADEFAGTAEGHKATFEVGLVHLQGRHDPLEASRWFAKAPEPADRSDAEALLLYLSAQEQLMKCELALDRDDQAEGRLKVLKAALPQFATELERFLQFEIDSRKSQSASKPVPVTDGSAKTPSIDPMKDARSTADDDVNQRSLEESVRRLGRVRAGAETEKAVAELARQGDATVEEIGRQIADEPTDFGMVHTSVRVLEKINSKKSRALLKKIALDEIDEVVENPGLRSWAAQALINCDPNQARELLSTSDLEVLETAINGLRGKGMDQALFNSLKPHIESENPWIRQRTASIMASDAPRGELAEQALKCIVKALVAVEDIRGLDQIEPSSGHVNYQMTVGEYHYHAYTGMLFHVKVDNTAIHETATQLQGRARGAVVLSLAYRGDKSVHGKIVKLAQDKDAGMFRAWAARALTEIGTVDDIPLLRKLSETDPLKRSGGGDVIVPGTRSNFPVRESAKNAINTFELRAKQKRSADKT